MLIERSIWLKTVAVIGAAGLLLFSFQNCGKAGFDQALDQEAMGSVDATSAEAPFAYNATFDQITYNSCAGKNLLPSKGFFTLRAGAYYGGGVSTRPAFMNYVKTKLKPIYPATEVSVEQIKQFVVGTTENAEAQLQAGMRVEGAPQYLYSIQKEQPATFGVTFFNLGMDLTDDRMMEPIFRTPGVFTNYFPLAVESNQRTLEMQLAYNEHDGMAQSFRDDAFKNILALTYTAWHGTPGRARMPSSAKANSNLAYGVGYKLAFGSDLAPLSQARFGPQIHPNNPNNILVQVTEQNLENPATGTGGVWTCNPDQRFTIVRQSDAAAQCPKDPFARMNDPDYRRRLDIVRHHLRADEWDVSVDGHCVVPKQPGGSCYRSDTDLEEPVQYNQALPCYQDVQNANTAETLHVAERCAQYVSICVRQ